MCPEVPLIVWIEAGGYSGVSIVDCKGARVDRVTAYCADQFGVHVKVLGTVNGGSLAVMNPTSHNEWNNSFRCVEFYAYLVGGRVVEKGAERAAG
jgi:hypothetical protein